jgi:lipopolysaccharide transport system ATP-binding protein
MYSSGMYMRLAFAVATSLEPEVLVIDEILSVGDINFQTKCMNRMAELRERGVTTIFVSHHMDAVRYFCQKGLVLDKGGAVAFGPVGEAIDAYYREVLELVTGEDEAGETAFLPEGEAIVHDDSWEARITRFETLDGGGQPVNSFKTGDTVTFRIHYETRGPVPEPSFTIGLYDPSDVLISAHTSAFEGVRFDRIEGTGCVDLVIEDLPLLSGLYKISVSITDKEQVKRYDWHYKCYPFQVVGGEKMRGVVFLRHHWVV